MQVTHILNAMITLCVCVCLSIVHVFGLLFRCMFNVDITSFNLHYINALCAMASECIVALHILVACKTAPVNDARGHWFVYRKVVANVGMVKRTLNNRFISNKIV